jgi:hypothetical protein
MATLSSAIATSRPTLVSPLLCARLSGYSNGVAPQQLPGTCRRLRLYLLSAEASARVGVLLELARWHLCCRCETGEAAPP